MCKINFSTNDIMVLSNLKIRETLFGAFENHYMAAQLYGRE